MILHCPDEGFAPYLEQIDQIEENVNQLEEATRQLDEYSKKLGWCFSPFFTQFPPDLTTLFSGVETKFRKILEK